ncbi:MAG: hypothetical protein NT169_23980 [Chloroflexi bacterium]|nr:hypothetical protein [Chloroflexota bacterium]
MDDLKRFNSDDWRTSPAYAQAMAHMQAAEWSQALTALRALQADYPQAQGVQSLIAEVELRLATDKHIKTRGRRLPAINRRVLFVVVLIGLIVALGWLASSLYRSVILPSLAQNQVKQGQDALAAQAEKAMAAKDYAAAIEFYDQLTSQNPTHPALADDPAAKARQEIALDELYRQAQAEIAAGQSADAQLTLIKLQTMRANYRDVSALLRVIERQQQLTALARRTADAKAAGDWEEVISRLEEMRAVLPREERAQVEADLFEAYMAYGAELVKRTQGGSGELTRAVEMYNKALTLRPGAAEATTQRNRARQYLTGVNSYTTGNWNAAIAQLEPLYTEQPDYLGGQAAQLLYNAYVHTGDVLLEAGEVNRAWERYAHAGQIQGIDTSTARALAADLSLKLTPTATTTPTPTQKPTLAPTGVPTATPTPGYAPLSRYRGKIVYWSTRNDRPTPTPIPGTPIPDQHRGGAASLWIMDPDGKNAFRIWQQDKAQEEYQKLQEAERRSPDGQSFLFVTTPRNEKHTQIYIAYPDGTEFKVTEWNGLQYDPVWSPKGDYIALVSNETGNDEIFLVLRNGEHPKRLTKNDWEWDKHPSWSPDGGRLVFWSNRVTGWSQIWLMNDDGSYQTNLSNNDFEEYDPIWIK